MSFTVVEASKTMEEIDRGLVHITKLTPRENDGMPDIQATPPYDSPVEQIFAETCFKHLSSKVRAEKQKEVVTKHGRFFLDFLLPLENERIGVECDGKEFHERLRDELRDAIILGEGWCHTIYRFRGNDLNYYSEDCIWLMSLLDPKLFSPRGHIHLERLHHLEFKIDDRSENFLQMVNDNRIDSEGHPYHFWAFRRSVHLLSLPNPLRYHWKVLYEFACKHKRTSIDDLLEIKRAEWDRLKSDDQK